MRPGASTRRDRALTRVSTGLGWASLGVLELTALPTIGAGRRVPWVREADALLVEVVSEGRWVDFGR